MTTTRRLTWIAGPFLIGAASGRPATIDGAELRFPVGAVLVTRGDRLERVYPAGAAALDMSKAVTAEASAA